MKILKRLMWVAFVGAMLAACSKDLETVDPAGPNGGTDPVDAPKTTMTFGLISSDLDTPASGIQLSAARADEEDADEAISFGLQPATRAAVAATDAEKTLISVCLVQFDGEIDDATLQYSTFLKKDTDFTGNTLSAPIYEFATTTIYAIANIAESEANKFTAGMTLKEFKEAEIGVSTVLPTELASKGLPMIGSITSADITDNSATINLSFLVAKVVVTPTVSLQTGLGTLTLTGAELRDVAAQASVTQASETDASVTASAGSQTGASGTEFVWYVPENMKGTVTGLTATQKAWWNAPNNATHVLISGSYVTKVTPSKTYDVAYTIFPGSNSTTDFNIKRNTVYTINPTIKGVNPKDLRLVVNGSTTTDLSASETANCYLAGTPLAIYKFKATVQGNGATTAGATITNGSVSQTAPAISATTMAPKSVKVLWETETTTPGEVIRAVKLVNGYVFFTTSGSLESTDPVKEANALIAVSSEATTSETNVLWSWHIWSTSYDPNTSHYTYVTRPITTGSYNNVAQRNEVVMTRNLGANNNNQAADYKSFGLLYQWGRKDPFVGASSHVSGTTTFAPSTHGEWETGTLSGASEDNIATAIKNPTMFYLQRNTSQYDWLGDTYANQRDNLWGNPNATTLAPNTARGSKSIYDPCPPGWRVAPQDTWTRFTTTGINTSTSSQFNVKGTFNYGWNFIYAGDDGSGSEAFYPAAGYRHVTTGALTYVGTHGYVWSSSSYYAGNRLAGYLGFGSGNVGPLNNSNRAYGFSVRCVQN